MVDIVLILVDKSLFAYNIEALVPRRLMSHTQLKCLKNSVEIRMLRSFSALEAYTGVLWPCMHTVGEYFPCLRTFLSWMIQGFRCQALRVLASHGHVETCEYLLCYDEFGLYVDKHGNASRGVNTMDWERMAERVALHFPYVH